MHVFFICLEFHIQLLNILFEVVLAVIYIEFALRCFSSLKLYTFTSMFSFEKDNWFLNNYTAQSLNNYTFLLFKYQPFVVFILTF